VANLEYEQITKSKILLVEGADEVYFLIHFLKAVSLGDTIQILPYGEIKRFKDFLESLKKLPGFSGVESIGIMRDADENPSSAFQSVTDALEKAGFDKPNEPLKTVGNSPKITIMIIPNIKIRGALESLLLETVDDDSTMICVNDYIKCLIENKVLSKENTSKIAKAKLYSYLAAKRKAGLKIGEAAKAEYWNFDSPVFEQLKNFLRML